MPVLNPQVDPLRAPPLDLRIGGQNGFLHDPQNWTSLAPYVRQQLFAVLITPPVGLEFVENGGLWLQSLKSLIELMPTKIDGLRSTVTNDFDGPLAGGAGEKLETVINATREVSAPSYTWPEKYNMSIARFWTEYSRMLIMDPDLKTPGIVASPLYLSAGQPAWLPEMHSFTVLYVEPDITMSRVVNAWLSANHMPKTGGTIEGRKEKGAGNDIPEQSIEFTALTQIGQAVNGLAQNYLNSLALQNLRPLDLAPLIPDVDVNVRATNNGLADELANAVLRPIDNS
jgi:hypothetical protein